MSQPVGTLVKAMDVLDALGETGPLGVLELSRRLDLDKSAVSRILTTFKSRDYVRVLEDGRYDLGLRLYELGQTLQERMPFREAVIPHIDAIASETGETAFAVHHSQGQLAYLYQRVSTKDIRLGEPTGRRISPWNHVAGRAILAQHEEAEVLERLATARRAQRNGLPTIDQFRSELAQVRKQSYAAERDGEKCVVAVAVMNNTAPVSAALMVGGPSSRIKQQAIKQLAQILSSHAAKISRTLGWVS